MGRLYAVNEAYFREITTEAQAWLLGLLATDGCVTRGRLQLALKQGDRPAVELAARLMGFTGPVRDYRARANGKRYWYSVFFVYSAPMLADLARLGIGPRKIFSVRPWDGPAELLPAYWRGALDGDGSLFLEKGKFWRLGFVGNRYMVEGFSRFIEARTGTRPGCVEERRGLAIVTYHRLPDLQAMVRLLYGDATAYLERKKAKADVILAAVPRCADGYQDWSALTADELLALHKRLGDWNAVANELGIPLGSMHDLRRRKGIFTPIMPRRHITFNGETKTQAEWERHLGLRRGTINCRLGRGWTEQEALMGR